MSPCQWIRMPDGTVAHVRLANQRTKKCSACGRLPSTKLCDFPLSPPQQVTHKRTCDKTSTIAANMPTNWECR